MYGNLAQQRDFTRSEKVITLKQQLRAVAFLHSMCIVHRDIKPENILVKSRSPDLITVLADFGLSSDRQHLKTFCGTPTYLAPEVNPSKARYTNKVDIWTLGVVALELVYNLPARNGSSWPQTVRRHAHKQRGPLAMLFQRMLDLQPTGRPSADDCLLEMEYWNSVTSLPYPSVESTLMPSQVPSKSPQRWGLFAAVETEVKLLNTSQSLESYKEDKRERAEQKGGKAESKVVAFNKKYIQDLEDVDEEEAETIKLGDQSNTNSERKAKNDQSPLMASHRSSIDRRSIIPNPMPCGQRKRQPKSKKILRMPSQLGTSPPVIH